MHMQHLVPFDIRSYCNVPACLLT